MGDNVTEFACPNCDRKFKSAIGLRSHSRIHNNPKIQSHVCKTCHSVFSRKKDLTDHITDCQKASRTTDKLWPCNVCSRSFADTSSLRIHFDSLHRNDKWNESFNDPNYTMLDVTLLGNDGSVPIPASKNPDRKKAAFSCHLCDKSFKNRFNLSVHVPSHYAKKNELYSCKTCKVTFRENIALRKHFRTLDHDRMKMRELRKITPMPDCYECAICNKEFDDKDELFKHSSTHSAIFSDLKCDLCCKTFKLPRLMQVHLQSKGHQLMEKDGNSTRSGQPQHPCMVCGKSFTLKSTLKAHLRNHVLPEISRI